MHVARRTVRRRDLRLRVCADLSRAIADLGVARGGVLYTAPFFVALGSHVFLGERLRASQWGGLALCFAGVALAIGVPQADVDAKVLLGDLMIVGGGAMWAATTLIVKATALLRAPAEKGLGYRWRFRSRFWRWRRGFPAKP